METNERQRILHDIQRLIVFLTHQACQAQLHEYDEVSDYEDENSGKKPINYLKHIRRLLIEALSYLSDFSEDSIIDYLNDDY